MVVAAQPVGATVFSASSVSPALLTALAAVLARLLTLATVSRAGLR